MESDFLFQQWVTNNFNMAAEIKVTILPVILVLMHLPLALLCGPDFDLKRHSEFFQISIFHNLTQWNRDFSCFIFHVFSLKLQPLVCEKSHQLPCKLFLNK